MLKTNTESLSLSSENLIFVSKKSINHLIVPLNFYTLVDVKSKLCYYRDAGLLLGLKESTRRAEY